MFQYAARMSPASTPHTDYYYRFSSVLCVCVEVRASTAANSSALRHLTIVNKNVITELVGLFRLVDANGRRRHDDVIAEVPSSRSTFADIKVNKFTIAVAQPLVYYLLLLSLLCTNFTPTETQTAYTHGTRESPIQTGHSPNAKMMNARTTQRERNKIK